MKYAGYSSTYENSASESYNTPSRATALPLRGYIGGNNGKSLFNGTQAIRFTKTPIFSMQPAAVPAVKEYLLIPDTPDQPGCQKIIPKALLIVAYRDTIPLMPQVILKKVIPFTRLIRQAV